MIADFNAIGRH